MNMTRNNVVAAVERSVVELLTTRLDPRHVFHDLQHTLGVRDAALQLADRTGLARDDRDVLELAALLHDVGFIEVYEGHEDVSCRIARRLLTEQNYPEEKIGEVLACIDATRITGEPVTLLQMMIHDADRAHLAADDYPRVVEALREEWQAFRGETWNETEWSILNHRFFKDHSYHTEAARELWGKTKSSNQKALKKRAKESSGRVSESRVTATRSAQMMFKTSLRNHIELSALADNKANIMLSINAIIITITMPLAAGYVAGSPFLMAPMAVLIGTCMTAMFFATMATRPSKMTGETSKEAVEKGEANLFFFGNFFRMNFDEYRDGMRFVAADEERLDSAILRDLFFLGKSLGRKYSLLRICYGVFLAGMGLTVLAFAVSYLVANI